MLGAYNLKPTAPLTLHADQMKTSPDTANTTQRADKKEQRRLQMADIARLAGVSTSTVSRALSGSKLVNDETKTRIAELAKSLNYSINIGAQNLRLKQSRTIAVVIPSDSATRQHLTDPFFLGMLGSLADALTERGFDMLVSRVDAEQLDSVSQIYDTGRASGIILIGQWRHHDQLNELALRQVPLVVWGAQLPKQLYVTVGSDNINGGKLATRHLLDQGRRAIAFFGDIQLPEVSQRYQGYCAALSEAGLPVREELVVAASFVEDGGKQAVAELCARQVKFDALFACSDLLAMTAINSLRERDFSVPADVAVVGYDDIELARYFHPPLTTIRQPMPVAGLALVDALLQQIDTHASQAFLLDTELIIRRSSQ